MSLEAFRDRILNDLLPAFCDDPARKYDISGFRPNFDSIHEVDAINFLNALDAGLIEPDGNMYRAPRSYAREQLFWEGAVNQSPRPITIWVEPIITVATLARLHFELGWPKDLLGTQSRDWAFDVAAYAPEDFVNERVACEVKKTDKELAALIGMMKAFGGSPDRIFADSKEKNAFKKVAGLRARRAPIFWAVGPGGRNAVFKMSYAEDGRVDFEEASLEILRYTVELSEVPMAPIPLKIDGAVDSQRNIELRLNIREALLVHRALRDKEATLRKEAWWLGEQADQDGADVLKREAQGYADAAGRIALILDRLMGVERPQRPRAT